MHSEGKVKNLLLCCIPYIVGLALVAALWRHPVVLAGLYCLLIMTMLAMWHAKSDIACLAIGALLGPMAELPAIHSGAWSYSASDSLIPVWLPMAWGIASLCIKKTTEVLVSFAREGKDHGDHGPS